MKNNPFKGDVIAAVRPENIVIVENEDKGPNVFSGEVEGTKLKPYFTELSINIGINMVVFSQMELQYKKGDNIRVKIPQEKIVVMEKH